MYGKIFKSMFEGTMRGKPDVLLIWTNLLVNADRDGFVDRTIRTISEETGLSVEATQKAIQELEAPDIESRSQELEGRRLERIDDHRNWGWRIVNYMKYAAIRNEEERREQNRLAQARLRARRTINSNQTSAYVINSNQTSPQSANIAVAVDRDITKTEAKTPPLPPNEKNQQNQGFQPDDFSSQSHKCESQSIQLTTQADVVKPEHAVIGNGKYFEEFLQTGRALREVKQPIIPATTNEDRDAETKKRQKVMEWFLRYISIHPKKTKRYLVEQIWCETFFNPSLTDEDAHELYKKIISALLSQKDKHPRDDIEYKFFPAADAWLRDGRWMDEVETRQPESLKEQAERLKKTMGVLV